MFVNVCIGFPMTTVCSLGFNGHFSPVREDRAPQWGSAHGSVSPLSPPPPPPPPLSPPRLLSVTDLHPLRCPPLRPPGGSRPGGPALCCGVEHADGPVSPALQRPSGPGTL